MGASEVSYREDFMRYLQQQKRYSKHTCLAYANDLSAFADYLAEYYAGVSWSQIRHVHIRSWLAYMRESHIKPRSINRKLSALKTFFKYLQRKEVINQNPCQAITSLKTPKRLASHLLPDEMATLLSVEPSDDLARERDRLIILLLYLTGMRRSELINLRVTDFDLSRNVLTVLGKGAKERHIPVTALLIEHLQRYLALREQQFPQLDHDYVLVTDKGRPVYPKFVYQRVHQLLGEVTTLQKRSPHTLRHTFATHLSASGADINAIKELLGHANLGATQIYTRVDAARLQAIYERSHPRSQDP